MARLLNVYQLWLDDLYPRAKFADGLAIIEKLGHTKRMQTMRREWINEGKPRESLGEGAEQPTESGHDHSGNARSRERPRTPDIAVVDDGALYAATPKSARDDGMTTGNDDTENLFLEDPTKPVPKLGHRLNIPTREENIDDDEDALSALNDVW